MEFNRSAGDLTQLSPLFIDDNRVAEAASIAQKLSNAHYHSLDILRTVNVKILCQFLFYYLWLS